MLRRKSKKKTLSDFKIEQSFLIKYKDQRDKLIVICEKCHSSYDYYKQDVCPKCQNKIENKDLLSFLKKENQQIFSGDALEPSNDIINDFEMHMYRKEELYSEIVEETDDKIKYVRTYFKGYNLRLSKKLKFYTTPCFRSELMFFDKKTGNIVIHRGCGWYTIHDFREYKIHYLTTHVKSNLNKYFVNGIIDYIENKYPILKSLESYVDCNSKVRFEEKRVYLIDLINYYQHPMFLDLFKCTNVVISFEYIDRYFLYFMSTQQQKRLKKSNQLKDYIEYYSGNSKILDYVLNESFFNCCCKASIYEYIINVSRLMILSPLFFYFTDAQYDYLFSYYNQERCINYFRVSYIDKMNSIFTDFNYDRSVKSIQYTNHYSYKYLKNLDLLNYFNHLLFDQLIQYNDCYDNLGITQLLYKFEKMIRLLIPALHYLNQTKQKEISDILLKTTSFNAFYTEAIKYLVYDYALILEINDICFLQIPRQTRMPICKNYSVTKLLNIQKFDSFYMNDVNQDSFIYIIKDNHLDYFYMVDHNLYMNLLFDSHSYSSSGFLKPKKIEDCLNQYLFITNQI